MSEAALIGQTIAGRFKLTGFIGEGAMATVYRGFQEAEPHDVAVKIMHAHLARDKTFAARFRREAKAAALLSHPHTVHIVDYGADGERLYIAMELISGQDLFEMLVIERRFTEMRAARIVAQVCDALTAAHSKGIVHRDLKPENVMLISDRRDVSNEYVKVLDFGIAKVLERDKPPPSSGSPVSSSGDSLPNSLVGSALTTVGVVVGTPAYMSPEQCRAEPVDARSDVYSCGILLYQLVCGRTPFTGDSPIEIAINQVRLPPDPPSTILPGIHPRLEHILLKALEKWPAQRQQSAAELRDELLALLPELSNARKPLSDGMQPPPPEVAPEDRAPGSPGAAPFGSVPDSSWSDDSVDLAVTVRREEGAPPAARGLIPAPPGTLPAAGGPIPPAPSTLPAAGNVPAARRPGGYISVPPPSSEPYSEPNRSEIFPRHILPIVPEPQSVHRPAQPQRAPAPLVQNRPPASASLPPWLVLVIAVMVGVAVGIVAHFVANR